MCAVVILEVLNVLQRPLVRNLNTDHILLGSIRSIDGLGIQFNYVVVSVQFFYSNTRDDYNIIIYTVVCEYLYTHACMFLIMWHFYLLNVHGSSLDDFQ